LNPKKRLVLPRGYHRKALKVGRRNEIDSASDDGGDVFGHSSLTKALPSIPREIVKDSNSEQLEEEKVINIDGEHLSLEDLNVGS
jgi:hypothetical protein